MATIHETVQYITDFNETMSGIRVINDTNADVLIENYWGRIINTSSLILNWSYIDTTMKNNNGIIIKVENIDNNNKVNVTQKVCNSRNRALMENDTSANVTYFVISRTLFQDIIYNVGTTVFHGISLPSVIRMGKVFSLHLGRANVGSGQFYLIAKVLELIPFEGGGGDGVAAGLKIPSN